MLLCEPRFRRGEGFGNRLFSWGRCRVFAKCHNAQVISPIWFRLSVGTLLRGGIDYPSYLRQIALWGLFDTRPGDLGVVAGRWRARHYPVIHEDALADLPVAPLPNMNARILFDRPWYSFEPLFGWEAYLLKELRFITRLPHLDVVDAVRGPFVGINIRCGKDFKPPPEVGEFYDRVGWLQRTPVSWYVECLNAIRDACGHPVAAILVSDGSVDMLEDILRMENVYFLRPGRATTDLLMLARARVLLASATSTFSAWAAFLGGMPVANAPGHPLTEWGISQSSDRYVGDFDPRKSDGLFLRQAAQRLNADG
ncbi:MAG: hypothetical protein WAT36_06860 [Chromatiaceae bacterium]